MSWGAPQWLWGLLALPMLALLFVHAESKTMRRLREFVSPRLLPQLAGTVDRFRRALRFAFQLLALGLAIVALAQPRWGYVYEEAKRKGLDLFIAIDTSRSMLSNDVQPNRLERVKLATQDLINELQGDRVGLIAFAGRAFVQAPLTIDYDAVVEAVTDLDAKTIPEGGTNISEAIALAEKTYGKSATGNRALILFTDGEELSGDAVKLAKSAAEAGVRIFTIGVGTPEGSLIPVQEESGGGTAFVKDSKGQVVKSKLDEKRLREIAEATGGFYLHLDNGPQTMRQLFNDGLTKMNASDIDARMSRRPIERYEWPLGAAMVTLTMSILLRERKRMRSRAKSSSPILAPATAILLISAASLFAAVPGLEMYREGKYPDAYRSFQEDLQKHPDSPAKNKMLFDAGTAAYKMRDYNKAIEAFSGALLSRDKDLQEKSHFNAGRTLEERADMDKNDDDALHDLTNAQTHYEDTLKLNPNNEAAKANLEEVKKKIERLKQKREPTPTPTPPPPQQQQKKDQDQKDQSQSQQNQQSSSQDQQQENQQQRQQAKNDQQNKSQPKPGESPSPSPNESQQGAQDRQSPSPNQSAQPSPSASEDQSAAPSPSPGEDQQSSGEGESPSPAPSASPSKKLEGEIKRADGEKPEASPEQTAAVAEAEENQQGQMSERQAEALLRAMKDEEARVQLDEHKTARRVYNDW
ncbi:MAG: Ca-activated chloride channel [Verrucomicrobiota bacterium]|jgi:Ca-activated chloride channel family protein